VNGVVTSLSVWCRAIIEDNTDVVVIGAVAVIGAVVR